MCYLSDLIYGDILVGVENALSSLIRYHSCLRNLSNTIVVQSRWLRRDCYNYFPDPCERVRVGLIFASLLYCSNLLVSKLVLKRPWFGVVFECRQDLLHLLGIDLERRWMVGDNIILLLYHAPMVHSCYS